jgi:biotin carboxylase
MRRCVLYVNLRRIPREGFESLLAARRLGYDVVMIARSGMVPDWARPLVDDLILVDTFDRDASLAAARDLVARHPVHGVANWTEIDVELVAHIAQALDLPGISPEAARRCRNKFAMKQALAHLDGVLPRFARVTSLDELERAIATIGYPAVVKPTGGSGSKGIFELHGADDLEPAVHHLLRIAHPDFDAVFRQFPGELIVEEFLEGDEFSVEAFVQEGRVEIVGVTDKVTSPGFHLELRHVFPSGLDASALAAIGEGTRLVATTLGMDFCSVHLEAKIGKGGFRFIEVAARPAGDYIATHVVPLASGVPYFENVVRVAVGLPLAIEPTLSFVAGVRFALADRPGIFQSVEGVETLLERPGYDHVFLEVPTGSEVKLPPEYFTSQRVAAVIGHHPDRERLLDLLDDGVARLRPVVEGSLVTA